MLTWGVAPWTRHAPRSEWDGAPVSAEEHGGCHERQKTHLVAVKKIQVTRNAPVMRRVRSSGKFKASLIREGLPPIQGERPDRSSDRKRDNQ